MALFRSARIGHKLAGVSCGLIVMAIFATSAISFVNARNTLLEQSEAKLQAIISLQAERVSDFFSNLDRDLTLRSQDYVVAEALSAFSSAFAEYTNPLDELQRIYIHDNPHPNGEKDALVSTGTGSSYDRTHTQYHPYFDALQNAAGYYDVFLFDTDGNLVYSVFKELDYATNLLTGEWADTGLGRVFKQANATSKDDPTVFDDFAPYGPSYGAAAAFFARPVFNGVGERIGVLAFQAPIDAINDMMSSIDGVSGVRDALLVGSDGLQRNDSKHTEEDDVLKTRIVAEYISDGIAGGSGFLQGSTEAGEDLLISYRPIELFGERWVVVANSTTTELVKNVSTAMWNAALVACLAIFVAMVVMLRFSRSVSQPLIFLSKALKSIAEKDFDIEVPARQRGDEIGHIADSVEAFRIKLRIAEENAIEIAAKSTAFEVSGAALLITDRDFKIRQVNSALTKMMRNRADDFRTMIKDFDPDDLIGKSMDAFHVDPSKARIRLANIENLPFKTKIAIGEAYVGLLVDSILDESGELIGYVLDWKDQTYQMQDQVIMDAIDNGQGRVELSLDGTVKSANRTFATWLNTDAADLVDVDLKGSLCRETEDPEKQDLWDEAKEGSGAFDRFQLTFRGSDITIDGCLAPIPDHKKNTKGYLLLGTDITKERKATLAAENRRNEMTKAQMEVVEALQSSLAKLSQGDLTATVGSEFAEDYEQLRGDYNEALQSLRSAMAGVLEATTSIHSDAQEVRSATAELSKRTENQAATLEETSAALTELTVSVQSTSEGAAKASQVVGDAHKNAEESGEVVRTAVAAMEEIETSSKSISSIITVIDDIAFQTNLLALNAGVEAARAGDAGRGFAVVASEVRALAQRASEAAGEISELINSSGQQVQKGATLVQKAGSALTEIISSVQDISVHVSSIAKSAKEQSVGISEINDAIADLDTATQLNAAMVEETTATSESLNAQSEVLSQTTSNFITDSGIASAASTPEIGLKSAS
jgi:methyl-accepting chemotaxis protein